MKQAHSTSAEAATISARENLVLLRRRQDRHLARTMELCATAHPHFRGVMMASGLSAADFRSVDDLRKLPVMTKADYGQDPESFRLKLEGVPGLALEETNLADVIYTTGSSGRPTPFFDTVHDRFSRVLHLKRVAEIAGIGPADTVMNLCPLSGLPHQGFASATWGSMAVGAKLLSGFTGRRYPHFPVHRRLDEALDTVEREQATVLWGITSYVRQAVMRAQELGKDLSSVRLAMVMGEPCPPGFRDDIRSRLLDIGSERPVVNNGYGFTEMMGPAIECVELGGRHQAVPDQFYFEVVDPDSHEPLPDGVAGLLLISHLNRRGTVLLRYAVGDIVALTHETCEDCGRHEPRFLGSPYRADGITKIKGTLVDPASLLEELSHVLRSGAADYQVVFTRETARDELSPEVLLVRLACADEDRERLQAEGTDLVRLAAEITPKLEFLPLDGFSEMYRGYKFQRFVDER